MATKATIKDLGDNTEEANEAPLAGAGTLADAVKKLLKKGRERGTITLDELNAVLPPERISSEFIEDVMAQLNDMGITVVEGEDGDGEAAPAEAATASEAEDYGRTDDPVRLYLREMGAVELLSREGEIAIAKRIEAGREMMIGGICESPLTIQAIVDWNEALKEGRLLLRDIIDLDATQGGPDTAVESAGHALAGAAPADPGSGDAVTDAAARGEGIPATDKPADGTDGEATEGAEGAGEDNSSFEDEDNISLAAIEEKLKPQVIETFDRIAATYGKLNKLQHARLDAVEKGQQPSKQSEAKIAGYQHDLVELVRTVRFNNARLEQLVQQLYTLNRRLMGLEGRLLRLGVDAGLGREEFLERYYGHELDPNWFAHVLQPPPPKAAVAVENPAERLIAQREKTHAADAIVAAKQAEKDAKAKVIADAKAAKAAVKLAEKNAKADAAKQLKDAARAAAQQAKDAATAKANAARQAIWDAQAKAAAKAAAVKQAAQEAKAKAAAKLAAQKARQKAPVPKKAPSKAPAKAIARPAPKAVAPKPVAKKAAAKPGAKKAAAKPAPKAAPKKAPAKKPAAKPAGKPASKIATKAAPHKSALAKSAKPAAKSKKR